MSKVTLALPIALLTLLPPYFWPSVLKADDYAVENRDSYELVKALQEDNVGRALELIQGGAAVNGTLSSMLPLGVASQEGLLQVVKALLGAGAEINLRDGDGRTALMSAAWHGRKDVVKYLLEKGADPTLVNMEQGFRITAENLALRREYNDIAEIIRKAAIVHEHAEVAQDSSLSKPVSVVSHGTNVEKQMEALLERMNDMKKTRDAQQEPVLPQALSLQKISDLLDIQAPDSIIAGEIKSRGVAFHVNDAAIDNLKKKAAGPEAVAALQTLLPKAFLAVLSTAPECEVEIDGKSKGMTDVHGELIIGEVTPGTIEVTITKEGFNPVTDSVTLDPAGQGHILAKMVIAMTGQQAFDEINSAIEGGDRDALSQLLQAKIDVNAKAADGSTALMWAAKDGKDDFVSDLLQAGADPNIQTTDSIQKGIRFYNDQAAMNKGATALMWGSYWGQIRAVKILLTAHADPNLINSINESPLMLAVLAGQVEVVKLLLAGGANVNARMLNGSTALGMTSDPEIIGILRKAGGRK